VNVRAFYQKGYDSDWVHKLGSAKATLDNRLAEWVAKQQDPLLYSKDGEQHAAVWVVLH
jgi:hypothetical protein